MSEDAKGRPGNLEDQGHNKIVRDLDRAFALAGLGTYEALVLQIAREGCWVIPCIRRLKDAMACRFNLSELAKQTGLDRSALSRAVSRLVSCRIFVGNPNGTYSINKQYRQWVHLAAGDSPERPRFSSVQIEFIKKGRDVGSEIVHAVELLSDDCCASATPSEAETVAPAPHPPVAPAQQFRCASATPPVAPAQQFGASPQTPLVGERALESESSSRGGSRGKGDEVEPFETTDNPVSLGGPGANSPDAITLGFWAEHLGVSPDGMRYSDWAQQRCDYMEPDLVRLLLESKVSTTNKPTIKYLTTVAVGWKANGPPASLAPKQVNGQHEPSKHELRMAKARADVAAKHAREDREEANGKKS